MIFSGYHGAPGAVACNIRVPGVTAMKASTAIGGTQPCGAEQVRLGEWMGIVLLDHVRALVQPDGFAAGRSRARRDQRRFRHGLCV
jgi:hypothetical protein